VQAGPDDTDTALTGLKEPGGPHAQSQGGQSA
jgi:hypothetical protein